MPYQVTYAYAGDADFNTLSNNMATTLTVSPATLDITANSTSKTYGQTVTLAGTAFTVGAGELFNGDRVTSVMLATPGRRGQRR